MWKTGSYKSDKIALKITEHRPLYMEQGLPQTELYKLQTFQTN